MSSTIAALKELIQLEEKRASLHAQLAALDSQLSSLKKELLGSGSTSGIKTVLAKTAPAKVAKAAAPARKGKKAGRAQRGGLAERILGELKAAGSKGIHVSDVAEKLGVGRGNISVWFATTGKKNK